MTYPHGALRVWFGMSRNKDVQRLQSWKNAPITYATDNNIDPSWNVDRYETILGRDSSGALFRRASQITLKNQFYPPEVMTTVSDYGLENRAVQTGDRVLQRIRIFQYNTLPVLEVLTMNEITEVIDEPRRAGFTYTTTEAHSELGEWSPMVEWRENDEVVLVIQVVSRPRYGASYFSRRFTRRMQMRAHKLSIQNFLAQLSGKPYQAPQPSLAKLPRLLPGAALLLSVLLFFLGFHQISNKDTRQHQNA